jgi:aspartyl-tRNA(Asn)/glutamyl-tRNA(Gln) amidotransferase subunit A
MSTTADLAAMAGAIERWGGDVPLAEEPARFLVLLETTAPPPEASPLAPASPPVADDGETLADVAEAIRTRRRSSEELTRACLDRIAKLDGGLRAFITVDAERALAEARARDAEAAAGRLRGPVHGVPLAYKDLCFIRGLPTSCGTRTPEYFTAEADCTAVARLAAAGAVTLGKLNMSELALGPFGDNAHHGHARNPWRPGHCAGGSSSGSGVAVAAGLAFGALGTDTGGSIRLPAACCGIVGLKPTYGRVSRAGAMALSWSNDHIGPLTRTVRDAAILLGVIAGHDPLDGTSSRRPVADYVAALAGTLAGLRIGVPEHYFADGVDAEVAAAVAEVGRVLAGAGAQVVPVAVPDPAAIADVTNLMSRVESAALHVRVVRERPHDLQATVRTRLETGFHVTAYDYAQALRLRARMARQVVDGLFAEVDLLLTPTAPEPPPAIADVTTGAATDIVARMGHFSRLTRPFNGLGLPALSVPCGFSRQGLPLAAQLVGRPFDEATVLRVGHAYERAAGWWSRRPVL